MLEQKEQFNNPKFEGPEERENFLEGHKKRKKIREIKKERFKIKESEKDNNGGDDNNFKKRF